MEKPFFSIVIPTYNRGNYLKLAIKSILRQNYDDYEIIITDNASTDNTKEVIYSFRNKKIKYFKNKENIGFNRNLYKAINLAQGKYIFILGDDDLILKKTTLSNIFKLIQIHNYGFIRLKFIYTTNYRDLFAIYFQKNVKYYLAHNANNIDLLDFLYNKAFFGFISGLIFVNQKNIKILELENAKNIVEISNFWISYLIPAIKLSGAYIDCDNVIVAKWSIYENPQFYNVEHGKLPIEKIWKLFFTYLSKEEKSIWIAKEIRKMIFLLPSIKYYSSNKNLLSYSYRMLTLDHKLYANFSFYFSLITGLLMPRFLWRLLRRIYQTSKIVKDTQTLKDFYFFKKRVYLQK